MMKPRILVLLTAALLVLAGCAPAASSSSASLPTPTIGLTYIPNVQFSPFYVAESQGSFTAAGVQPTLRHHGSSEGLFTAIASGQEQFVVAGADEMMQARSQGVDLVAVASYYRTYPVAVIVPKSSQITTLADLRGHTIGIPGRYGESWFGLKVALASAGLSESDVKITEIGYTQQAALSTGKVDAIVGFTNNEAVQFALAGFATRTLAISSGTIPLVSVSLITTTTYAKENPAVVKAVAAGMISGIKAVIADPQQALDASAKYIPGLSAAAATKSAKATLAATVKVWSGSDGKVNGRLDETQFAKMATFMADHGLTSTKQDAAAALDNSFVG